MEERSPPRGPLSSTEGNIAEPWYPPHMCPSRLPEIGLSDLTTENTGHTVKCAFQINNQ